MAILQASLMLTIEKIIVFKNQSRWFLLVSINTFLTCLYYNFYIKLAISQAMKHDGSSGGIVRMVCISKDGVTREFIDYKNLPYKQ